MIKYLITIQVFQKRILIILKICNDRLTLLGVWGSGNYIEDIYVYLQIHKEKLKNSNNVLICGDLNWDKKHKRRTHSEVVKQLEDINLYSCYHYKKNGEYNEQKIYKRAEHKT